DEMNRRTVSLIFIITVALMVPAVQSFAYGGSGSGSGQTHLDPSTLTKYLDPLPVPAKLDGAVSQTITMSEFTQQVLPSNFKAGPYGGKTLVWGYNNSYPGPTVEAKRGFPFHVTYVNNIINPALLPFLPYDQTLNWANPLGCNPTSSCAFQRYTGPIPVVAHFHGGEVPSAFDGGPNSWFTPGAAIKGPDYVTSTFTYPNAQEASTYWYHDHTMGITRLNVYAGLAGFYLLRDSANEPSNLPKGSYEREIAIQDRMFDTNGQLFYPVNGDSHSGSDHPFWVDMFMGDTIVVNGKAWPYLNVEPRRYRLRLLNGSNTRSYTLQLQTTSGSAGPVFWQIGTDGGLLNKPKQLSQITFAPGERIDVIVDFTGKQGKSYILKNSDSSWGSSSIGEIMKVNVSLPLNGTDTSLNPSTGPNLRPNNPIVNLAQTVNSSTPIRYMTLEKNRDTDGYLLNGKFFDDAITEKPRVGSTEVWQLDNRTGDTHPIHLHLVEFQILSSDSHHSSSSYGTDSTASGWKDTINVGSWDTVSIVVRWAPLNTPAGAVQPGQNLYPFDPTATLGTTDAFGFPGGAGYVWHCHRLEHEDNEMMRPYVVVP
ncbi:MAG TPA: multicopper oxidase domain-containing protein, partial [Nitrospirota bacterium]